MAKAGSDNQIYNSLQAFIAKEKDTKKDKIEKEISRDVSVDRKNRTNFEKNLYLRWGKAFDLFEAVSIFGRNLGEEFNSIARPYAATHNDFVFEVLSLTHARSCKTMGGIFTLLRSGYASDALARARTMHELRVIASFIKNQGNDIARKYLLFKCVDQLNKTKKYIKYQDRLKLETISQDEISELETAVEKYKGSFSSMYAKNITKGDYQWVAEVLQKNKGRVTFADIEASVDLDHMRPYYGMASDTVHAGTNGIIFDIGNNRDNIMLAGPSNAGLADPADIALISFYHCTVLLLTTMTQIDDPKFTEIKLNALVSLGILDDFTQKARNEFFEIHKQLMQEEATIRN